MGVKYLMEAYLIGDFMRDILWRAYQAGFAANFDYELTKGCPEAQGLREDFEEWLEELGPMTWKPMGDFPEAA